MFFANKWLNSIETDPKELKTYELCEEKWSEKIDKEGWKRNTIYDKKINDIVVKQVEFSLFLLAHFHPFDIFVFIKGEQKTTTQSNDEKDEKKLTRISN